MIFEEKTSNRLLSKISIGIATISSLIGKLKDISSNDNTDENLKYIISSTDRIIDDLNVSITRLRDRDARLRKAFRLAGNTNRNVLINISKNESLKKIFSILLGVNLFENYTRVRTLVKALSIINRKRITIGGCKNFSKEIRELEEKLEVFLEKRNASVYTGKCFNY